MKHKIVINVTGENGEKKQVLRGAVMRLPQRFIRWLFGDYSQRVFSQLMSKKFKEENSEKRNHERSHQRLGKLNSSS